MGVDYIALLDQVPDLVFLVDEKHRLVYGNQSFFRVARLSRDQVLGVCMWSVWDADKYEVFKTGYEHVLATGERLDFPHYDMERDCHRHISMVPSDGCVLVTCHDVTGLKRTIQELIWSNEVAHELLRQFATASRQAIAEQQTDLLTGLSSRSRVEDYAEGIFRVTKCKNLPLSFAIADVDHFKSFNDEFGHQVGDEILKSIARTFMGVSHDSHILGRYGGEEFLLILPNVGLEDATQAMESYRMALENVREFGRPVTASFGVASVTASDPDWKSAVLRADRALYDAKTSGRNRVVSLTHDQARAA